MPKYDTKVNKLPKSEVDLEAELPAEHLSKARAKALEKFGNSLEIAGFRKGKIPENIIIESIGEKRLLEESAQFAINEHYPHIVEELGLDAIGKPSVQIIKLAFGNPLSFKIRTAVLPQFKLPDYKSIASSAASAPQSEATASQEETEEVILQIRKNKAHADWHKANPEEKDHSKHPDFEKEENLPKLDDEFAKIAGNFENLEGLRAQVKKNILEDKKLREIEKKRAAILEELIKNTEIELPEILVESEIEKSLAQIKDDINRIGGKFEDYLSHMKKTEEDLRKDLRQEAEKRAKIQLVFNKIAEIEKISPDKTILEAEVKKILEFYPGANEDNARIYIATSLINQEVLKLLERQK